MPTESQIKTLLVENFKQNICFNGKNLLFKGFFYFIMENNYLLTQILDIYGYEIYYIRK